MALGLELTDIFWLFNCSFFINRLPVCLDLFVLSCLVVAVRPCMEWIPIGNKNKTKKTTLELKDSLKFWIELCGNPFDQNGHADWLMTLEVQLEDVTQQSDIIITKKQVSEHLQKMPNWKAWIDGLHGFWIEHLVFRQW